MKAIGTKCLATCGVQEAAWGCDVPPSMLQKDPGALGHWVDSKKNLGKIQSNTRRMPKQYEQSRIDLLDGIDFKWNFFSLIHVGGKLCSPPAEQG